MTQVGRLVIIGVGLIGGSAALALRQAGLTKHVCGVGRSRANLEEALRLGIVDTVSDDYASAARSTSPPRSPPVGNTIVANLHWSTS